MREFTTNDQANYYSGITSITVNGKNAYELKGKFLDDLHKSAFSGTNGEDAVEHIEYFLRIVDPIDLPNVNQDKLRVVVFPISLVGDAWKWFDEIKGSIDSWVDLTANFFGKYYPPSRTGRVNTPKIICREDRYCNGGNLPGAYIVGNHSIIKTLNDDESSNDGWRSWENFENKNGDRYEREYENDQEDEARRELFDDTTQELPVCNIRRFKMIKYSFRDDEEYVAVKEDEYDDLMST
ncbi:hypothetical protein Tco_0462886 [Tanacetum coccineum]